MAKPIFKTKEQKTLINHKFPAHSPYQVGITRNKVYLNRSDNDICMYVIPGHMTGNEEVN